MVDILFDKRLKNLESPNTQAYDIKGKPGFFCLICNNTYEPRYSILSKLQSIKSKNILVPQDQITVTVPYDINFPSKVGFIFRKPKIPKLNLKSHITIKEIKNIFLQNLVNILEEFNLRGITHRAIRPDNIFFSHDSKAFCLGECITSQPGAYQPDVFEEINREICIPFLRGNGTIATDCYALGVLIISILSGDIPLKNVSARAIAETKYEKGSFSVLIPYNSRQTGLKDILQGLLLDDEKLRWGINDIKEWMQGFSKIKNSIHKSTKTSPIKILGTKITSIQQFIIFVIQNWKTFNATTDIKKLKEWISKNFSDKAFSEKLNNFISFHQTLTGEKNRLNDFLCSGICFCLNSSGPIIWKHLVFMPDAIPQLLIYSLFVYNSRNELKELAHSKLISYLSSNFNLSIKNNAEIIEQELSMNTNGFEYCLYMLNPQMPCMSPITRKKVIFHPEELMETLEENVDSLSRFEIVDSHIVTFIYQFIKKFSGFSKYELQNLNDDINKQIKMLIHIEEISHHVQHPKLTKFILELCQDFVNDYKNKETREKLREILEKPSAQKLTFKEIYALINNVKLLEKDRTEFKIAKKKYNALENRIIKIEKLYLKNQSVTRYFSEKITLFISIFVSLIIISLIIKRYFFGD